MATDPTLSIVVAAWPDLTGLTECLESLAPQRGEAAEVFVVSAMCVPTELRACYPWVNWVEATPDRLIPHLWGLGISRTSGDVIAITTAHFAAESNWISTIRQAHGRFESPAIGGRIEPPRGGRAVDWATYFLRYSSYLAYDREQAVPDLAGDNASYKRVALDAYPELLRDGFWELDFHHRLRAEGKSLMFVPAIRVTQRTSFGFRRFLRQRVQHGRHFGQTRFRGRSGLIRAIAVAASPLIPLVFLAKIVARVARSRRDFGPFLWSLPILICFLIAWSVGEALGYLLPAQPRRQESLWPDEHGTLTGAGSRPREV